MIGFPKFVIRLETDFAAISLPVKKDALKNLAPRLCPKGILKEDFKFRDQSGETQHIRKGSPEFYSFLKIKFIYLSIPNLFFFIF